MTSPSAQPNASHAEPARLIEAVQRCLERESGRSVQRVETHISWVLLDGEFAWKIKKPVRLGFLDYSTLEVRRHLCDEELRLNRRLAPTLYLDVVPIGGTPDAPLLSDPRAPIEYALRMKQFANGSLFSERLHAGTLECVHIDALAQRLAAFHRDAAVAPPESDFGTPPLIEAQVSQLFEGLRAQGAEAACAPVRAWMIERCAALRPCWQRRHASGRVREGHGDLHLANAVVLGDDVTAFDCIEFDPALRWIDVFDDIAFTFMDLLAHGRADFAFRLLDGYLEASGDHDGLTVLPWYAVYRALVRGLVGRIRVAQGAAPSGPDYLALALRLTAELSPRLLITHGLSGSGKSTVAQHLLERAGAVRLRSDVERKRLFGLDAHADSARQVSGGIYTAAANERTYGRLLELAAIALDAGYPTIVDAAFLRADERARFAVLARERHLPFSVLHCYAGWDVLRDRVRARHTRGDDASEADLAVLEQQRGFCEALQGDEQAASIVVATDAAIDFDAVAKKWLDAR